jgi:RND family efflux transporter MFP subunit
MKPPSPAAPILAAFLAACHGPTARPAPEATAPTRAVRTAAAADARADGLSPVPALVAARQRATLGSRIPAAVLPFREGDRVAAGDVVVRLDDAALRSAVAAAEAALRAAEADLARTHALHAAQAATTREVEEAEARAAGARAALAGARDGLAYAVLRAPFSGSIATLPVNVGDVVSPGTPLLQIEGDGGLEVRATLGAAEAARVRIGQRLTAEVDGRAEPIAATVRSLSPAADPATHRVELRADLAEAGGIRSGLFARLLIPAVDPEPRITVPASAVVQRGGLSGVFVVSEGRARLRWVALGAASGESVEVRAGLAAGELVVLEPSGLADGDRTEGVP